MNFSFSLYFIDAVCPSLHETLLNSNHSTISLRTTRGKTSGAYIGYGTFQWTTAVRALSILVLETKLSEFGHCEGTIRGGRPSLACSLDESINKGTSWLAEMLGSNISGRLLAKSLILRTNSSLKRSGDVVLRINPKQLRPADIKVFLDQKELTQESELTLLKEILCSNVDQVAEQKAIESIAA